MVRKLVRSTELELRNLPSHAGARREGQMMKAIFKRAVPYQEDEMSLPVKDVETAIPFYRTIMGFHLVSRGDSPFKSAILGRDAIQIGLAENGSDPTQDGCFFEVDDVEAAFGELRSNGLAKEEADFRIDRHGEASYKVFFVIAPDGLCYCLGERQQ